MVKYFTIFFLFKVKKTVLLPYLFALLLHLTWCHFLIFSFLKVHTQIHRALKAFVLMWQNILVNEMAIKQIPAQFFSRVELAQE